MWFHQENPLPESFPHLNCKMHYFIFIKNQLYCEDLKVYDLAKEFGTPLYVYSKKTILDHFFKIKRAFSSIKPIICYSVKANSNLSILKLLVKHGSGLDIVSGGELYRAKIIGCPPKRIVYASVGKTDEEIKDGVKYGILMFNVESLAELEKIDNIANRLRRKVDIGLRINPDIESKTHEYIVTGKKESKFGMDFHTIESVFINRVNYPNLNIVGLHIHIGSQITQAAPFIKAIKKVLNLLKKLEKKSSLKYFNIGGGLGITYDKEKPQTAKDFARRVIPLLKECGLKIILEPGRFIVGNAGILVTKVLYLKDTPKKRFIIVDAGMNDLIRPALYNAYHRIVPLCRNVKLKRKSLKPADIVGPICETSDFLGKDRFIEARENSYLAVLGCGAYGFTMSSNYNSRRRAAEVLVDGKKVYLIRKRESYKDLVDKEINLLNPR